MGPSTKRATRGVRATPSLRRGASRRPGGTRRAATLALVLGLGGALDPPSALAQPAPDPAPAPARPPDAPPPQATTTRPVPLATPLAYPDGGAGSATVELELSVAADGSVSAVTVRAGEEPFAAAALAATREWRFNPATRDGTAVAARIRFEVTFVEERAPAGPSPSPQVQSPSPPVDTTTAPPPGELAPIEITVVGEREGGDVQTLTRAEVRELPGAFGDPFRAIEIMPGVAPIVSGAPYFFIRGAPPGNVGYSIDGIAVPQLFHAFVGPGVLHPALVERVDLFRGGYPARYGRYTGGIVAATTRPLARNLGGEVSVRLIDAGALAEAPIARGRGAVLLGGRYSYTGLILSALVPEAHFGYWDYQSLVELDAGARGQVGLLTFGAFDYLAADDSNYRASTQFHRVDLRYDHQLSPDTDARIAVTGGLDRLGNEASYLRDRLLHGRLLVDHRLDEGLSLHGGFSLGVDRYSLGLEGEGTALDEGDILALLPSRDETGAALWMEAGWQASPRVTVVPGLRADLFRTQGDAEVGVDPRLTARYVLSPRVTTEHSIGTAHQSASYIPGVPAAQVLGLRGGLQRSLQASSGVELSLPEDISASVTLFESIFFNLSDPLGVSREFSFDPDLIDLRAFGAAYGAELLVRRELSRRIGGYLAYTLSRSTRSRDTVHGPAAFDRSHVVNLAAAFDLGRRFRFGARVFAMSGVPTERTTTAGPTFDGTERSRPYYRLDARLEKQWRLGESGTFGLIAEVLNATATKQVTARSCNARGCTEDAVGPIILPSLGAEARW